MKASKYNYLTYDEEGNLIIYNFRSGLNSLVRVEKKSVDLFIKKYMLSEISEEFIDDGNRIIVDNLSRLGILVPSDINETVSNVAFHYNKVLDSKLHLTVLPTGKCMFGCPYCYESTQKFHRNAMTVQARNTLVRYVQRIIANHTSLEIGWYGGEPLLELDTIKYLSEIFIKICKIRHLPYIAEITTNGYLLTPDVFDMLYRLKVYTYMITLDGFREQHDKIRFTSDGKGSFDTIINNLLHIYNNKQYKFVHIIVRVNVSRDVYDRLDEFVNYVASIFTDDSRFEITFAAVVSYTENSRYGKFVDPFKMYEQLFDNEVYMNKIYNEKLKIGQLVPEQKCVASLKNAYVIMPDLSVYKCYSFFENPNNKIGFINSKGNLVVDEAKHKKWYFCNEYVQDIPEKCTECFYSPCCRLISPGCPVRYTKKQAWQECVLEKEDFIKNLNTNIIYAARKHPVTIIEM